MWLFLCLLLAPIVSLMTYTWRFCRYYPTASTWHTLRKLSLYRAMCAYPHVLSAADTHTLKTLQTDESWWYRVLYCLPLTCYGYIVDALYGYKGVAECELSTYVFVRDTVRRLLEDEACRQVILVTCPHDVHSTLIRADMNTPGVRVLNIPLAAEQWPRVDIRRTLAQLPVLPSRRTVVIIGKGVDSSHILPQLRKLRLNRMDVILELTDGLDVNGSEDSNSGLTQPQLGKPELFKWHLHQVYAPEHSLHCVGNTALMEHYRRKLSQWNGVYRWAVLSTGQ